jgi:hypothetical protein
VYPSGDDVASAVAGQGLTRGSGAGSSVKHVQVGALATAVRDALTGPAHRGQPVVVWSDRDSEILLLLERLQVKTLTGTVVVAVDTESAEFGLAPLIVRFVFGGADDPAPLVAATDEGVLGHPAVASRWGALFRDVVWAAIVRLSVASAAERGLRPSAIVVDHDQIGLVALAHPAAAPGEPGGPSNTEAGPEEPRTRGEHPGPGPHGQEAQPHPAPPHGEATPEQSQPRTEAAPAHPQRPPQSLWTPSHDPDQAGGGPA